jgi:hypothetical protein
MVFRAYFQGDPMADDFDPLRLLASLRSHGARYVLVGGLAAAVRGGPIETDDVDICIPRDDENYGCLALALRQLAAVPVGEDAAARSSYLTSCGPLDVIELGDEFDDFFERASVENLGNGVTCPVASTEDLIQLKRLSGELATVVNLVSLQQPPAEEAEPEEAAVASVSAQARPTRERDRAHEDEFGSTREHRGPRWMNKMMDTFEDIDGFMTRVVYGDENAR